MLTQKHLALIRAALLFFDEENSPHGPPVIAKYVDETLDDELTASDVAELRTLLQGCQLRYVCCDPTVTRLIGNRIYESIEGAKRRLSDPNDRVVTVLDC